MPRRARAMSPVIPTLARGLARGFALACGFALAGTLPQASGGSAPSWPAWSRPALAQDVGTQLQPSEWRRLTGPLPYRPGGPDSGWLSETDLERAVDLIADLGLFFAKLSESDPDTQARLVWGRGDAVYGAAAEDLRAANEDGKFRIIISEGSSLAITRRGEEIWVDSDLAGAWNVKRVRRARWQGDDWPDIAALSALLFDLWRGQETAASGAWLDHQLDSLAVSRAAFEEGGADAATAFTRYGILKDLFFKANLLRDATVSAANAAPWHNRAQRIEQQTDSLLRSVATTSLGGELAKELRGHWAAYAAEIEQSSAERSALLLAALRPAPAPTRAGAAPRTPEQEPVAEDAAAKETATKETAAEETAAEDTPAETDPAAETGPPQAVNIQARDQDYIALLLARTVDAARTAEEAERQADTMARQAGAAILAAEQARDTLATTQTGREIAAEETARLRQQAEELAAELDQARGGEAALQDRLTQAEDRASAAEAAAAKSAAEAAEGITDLQGQLTARDADLTHAEVLAETRAAALAEAGAEIDRIESQNETLQATVAEADGDRTALAAAESERTALETKLEARQTELAAAQSRAESAAEETAVALDRERARATELDVTLAEARQTLVAAQERTLAETARATQAEAAAAAAGTAAQAAKQDLAARDEELASLREEVRALRQESESQAQTDGPSSPPSRVPTWLEDWLAPIVAAALLAGGLMVLLAVSRRRAPVGQPVRQPVHEAGRGANEAPPASAPDIREPVTETPAKERPAKERPAVRPSARPTAARHPPAAAATSASIVGAVRRQDWATAEAQFAQLSGVSAPRLKELLGDPSGELLALACRAADLDRLTFAALYLLQGQGRAVADPEVVAGAIGLFEKTGPAEAQRILAERRDRDSLSA